MKKLIFSVLAVAALASCSKSELVERPVVDGDVAIKLTSEVLTVKQAIKAPFEGITATDSLVARVIASTTSGDFASNTSKWHDDTISFVNGSDTKAVGYNPSRAYPTDGSSVFLCGLYPASMTDWMNFSTSNTSGVYKTTAEYTFDGKTDVMLAAQVETKKSEALVGTFKKLVFNHMLTKLVIRAKAKTTAAVTDFGGITEIVLTKANGLTPNTTMLGTLNDGTADPSKAANFTLPDTMAFYTFDNTTTPGTAAATDSLFSAKNVVLTVVDGTKVTVAPSIGYSMVAPIIADGTEDYELLVKTEKNPAGFPVKINLKDAAGNAFTGSTQGKAFVVTILFESTPIEALGEVTDWENIVLPGDITIK